MKGVSNLQTEFSRPLFAGHTGCCQKDNLASICRLEGFKDPWEVSVYKGRSMDPKGTLEAHGITSDATITSVRRVLVPEGVFSMAMLPVPWIWPLWTRCMICCQFPGVLPLWTRFMTGDSGVQDGRSSLREKMRTTYQATRTGEGGKGQMALQQARWETCLLLQGCVNMFRDTCTSQILCFESPLTCYWVASKLPRLPPFGIGTYTLCSLLAFHLV